MVETRCEINHILQDAFAYFHGKGLSSDSRSSLRDCTDAEWAETQCQFFARLRGSVPVTFEPAGQQREQNGAGAARHLKVKFNSPYRPTGEVGAETWRGGGGGGGGEAQTKAKQKEPIARSARLSLWQLYDADLRRGLQLSGPTRRLHKNAIAATDLFLLYR